MPLYSFLAGNGMAHPVEAPGVQRAKRKLWEQPNGNMDMVEMEGVTIQDDCPAKRQCMEIFPHPAGDDGIVLKQGQLHQFASPQSAPIRKASFGQAHLPEADQEIYGCMKDVAMSGRASAPLPPRPATPPAQIIPLEPQQLMMSQSPMMMDGETYNCLREVDLDEGISSMESDGAPDPAQYESKLEFCSTPCTGGLRSPDSNVIRCSCKPWDRRDFMPYVSDYY